MYWGVDIRNVLVTVCAKSGGCHLPSSSTISTALGPEFCIIHHHHILYPSHQANPRFGLHLLRFSRDISVFDQSNQTPERLYSISRPDTSAIFRLTDALDSSAVAFVSPMMNAAPGTSTPRTPSKSTARTRKVPETPASPSKRLHGIWNTLPKSWTTLRVPPCSRNPRVRHRVPVCSPKDCCCTSRHSWRRLNRCPHYCNALCPLRSSMRSSMRAICPPAPVFPKTAKL
ncbi:hypothetical protein C8R45DRAFT_474639 [Mycena sanguinolenta]|nr:hypothetical protein C8R45DRAFT_474639 [Mycena sanguinolenta]